MVKNILRKLSKIRPKYKVLILTSLIVVSVCVAFTLYLRINQGYQDYSVKMLFIGNSLTYNYGGVDYHVEQLGSSASPSHRIEADDNTASMAHLALLSSSALEMISAGQYDYVIVQGTPYLAGIESFKTHASLLIEASREVGAEPVLFMAWEALGAPWWKPDLQPLPLSVMAQAHYDLAEKYDILVAPVGLAFKKVNDTRPGYYIYSDVMHSSMNGTYLAALVIYATIFNENPVGLSYRPTSPPLPSYFFNVSAVDAIFLQEIAWETVQENSTQSNKGFTIQPTIQSKEFVYSLFPQRSTIRFLPKIPKHPI